MPLTIQRKNHFASRKEAMGQMNVTPFIDVLLVLLVMLILAIPIKPNITQVDLPSGEPVSPRLTILGENTVHIAADDRLFWNGEALSTDELRLQVATASGLAEQPVLRFAPDAQASYDRSARVIALINEEGADKFAFIGNHNHRDF